MIGSALFPFAAATFLGSALISNTYGLVQPAVRAELGLSATLAGAVFSLYALCFAAGSRSVGALVGRTAPATLLRAGLGTSLAGHALMLLPTGLPGLLAGFALIGVGEGWAMATVSSLVTTRFAERRSRALSLLEIAFSTGAIATPAIVATLGGWRPPYALSAAVLVGLLAWSALPRTLGAPAADAGAGPPATAALAGASAATRLGFLVCFLAAAVEWGGSVWLPSFARAAGASPADAALAMSLLWAGFLASRLLGAVLFGRADVDAVLIAASGLGVAGAATVVLGDGRLALLGGSAVLGLGTGCLFPGTLGRLVDLDPERAAAVTGTALALTAVAGVALPVALGGLADLVGVGTAALVLPAAALATAGALIAMRTALRRMRAAHVSP